MNTVRILSIDGGGIRGIIPLMVLKYIENKTDQQLHQLFNVIGGTSTGGIIALGLNSQSPKTHKIYTSQELLQFYTQDAKQIFQKDKSFWEKVKNRVRDTLWQDYGPGITSPEYGSDGIETYLQEKFGQTKMSQLGTGCDVTVFSYDLANDGPYEFNNRKAGLHAQDDYYVWQAARATSAAPTFFPGAKFSNPGQSQRVLVDGGVYINNPALDLLLRAQKLYPQAEKFLLVSLGTGIYNKSRTNLISAGALNWLRDGDLLAVMMSGVSDTIDQQLKGLTQAFSNLKYYRYQEPFSADIAMDGIEPKNLELLQQLGQNVVTKNQVELDQLCAELTTSSVLSKVM